MWRPAQLAGGHALVYFQEVGGAVFARQALLTRDAPEEEDDITNFTKTDSIVEIDSRKFHVTFSFYNSS